MRTETMDDNKKERINDEMSKKIIETAEYLVTVEGAETLTVRKILCRLEITNRVFYNRFRNIEEVLGIVYRNIALKIRESLVSAVDVSRDFFAQVTDVVVNTLLLSYDLKMRFNQYVFDNDSRSENNYEWWKNEICKLVEYAKTHSLIRTDIDSEVISYAIWCFCRGYNADAVARQIPRDEAAQNFRYSFGILLDGMRVHATA